MICGEGKYEMAKKRLKHLTKERAELLLGFDKILERIWDFESEIKVKPPVQSYYESVTVDKEPVYLQIHLDRKNRELRSLWCKGTYPPCFSSPSVVHIGTFYAKYQGTKEELRDFLIKMLIEALEQWTKYDEERRKEEEDDWGSWSERICSTVKIPVYPEKYKIEPV